MTVWRSMDRGSFIVRRRLLGIRIRRATGFYTRREAGDLERLLLKLALPRLPRPDLITAFANGSLSGPELVAGVERYGLETYRLTARTATRLRGALFRWLRGAHDLAWRTRRDYRWNLGAVVGKLPPIDRRPTVAEERALRRGPDISEAPALLRRYARRAKPYQFVQARAAFQSFFRHTLPEGEQSDLWRQVTAIQGQKRPRRKVQGGLTPDRARGVAEGMATTFGPLEGQGWWTLCCTGMEPKECFRKQGFEDRTDRTLVHGTKRDQRDRIVVRLVAPVRPTCGIRTFRKHLRQVGDQLGIADLTPYVGRRTFAHWLELAKRHGITDSQCDMLLGHAPKGDRDKYREHDIVPYLPTITRALRKVIGDDPKYVRAVA